MQISDSIVIIPTIIDGEHQKISSCRFGLPKIFHILVMRTVHAGRNSKSIVKTLQQEFPERLFL